MNQKMIDRINELAQKSKSTALSAQEVEEQRALRKAYLENFKKNLRNSLDHIYEKGQDGQIRTLGEIRRENTTRKAKDDKTNTD